MRSSPLSSRLRCFLHSTVSRRRASDRWWCLRTIPVGAVMRAVMRAVVRTVVRAIGRGWSRHGTDLGHHRVESERGGLLPGRKLFKGLELIRHDLLHEI